MPRVLVVLCHAVTMTLALVACEDVPRITAVRRVEDPWAFAQPVMAAGPLLVIVRGRPVFAAEPAVEERVLQEVIEAVTWTATSRFTLDPVAAARAGMRVIFAFNAPTLGDPCREDVRGGEPRPDGTVALLAAFCDGSDLLSRVDGRVGRIDGLDDRHLAALIDQATRELLGPPAAPRP